MTLVRFFRTRHTAHGRIPVKGKIHFTPSRAQVIAGDPDEVIMPASFTVEMPETTGRVDVDLMPTPPGWAWQIHYYGFGVASETVYALVPEPVPDPDHPGEYLPIDVTDLVLVDKDSLIPSEDTLPAWTATLAEIQALRTETVQAAGLVAGASQAAQAAADRAAAAATNAELTITYIPNQGMVFTQGGFNG